MPCQLSYQALIEPHQPPATSINTILTHLAMLGLILTRTEAHHPRAARAVLVLPNDPRPITFSVRCAVAILRLSLEVPHVVEQLELTCDAVSLERRIGERG